MSNYRAGWAVHLGYLRNGSNAASPSNKRTNTVSRSCYERSKGPHWKPYLLIRIMTIIGGILVLPFSQYLPKELFDHRMVKCDLTILWRATVASLSFFIQPDIAMALLLH